jgi:DNA-binding NarL/FixJ family response regulator/class 3 adenylate cyclase
MPSTTSTVTLLFTDIEGSTRLVRHLGNGYVGVLAEHSAHLRAAFERHDGEIVDTQGDAFFAAFPSAAQAVCAAADAQRALHAHSWPEGAEVRVRIGIHSGHPLRSEGRYFGLDVNRAARICAAGRGGQVLLSHAARDELEGSDPDGLYLHDLGVQRLKDFDDPERVYGVEIAGLGSPGESLRGEDEQSVPKAVPPAARVVLADDSVLLREGVARLLVEAGFEVVGQVDNPDDLLRRVGFSKPDVAIVDIRMPPTQTDEGLRAAKQIRERYPGVGVLVLSQYVEPGYAMELLSESSEGVGYLLKDRVSDIEEFAGAVRRVAQGGSALDPAVVSQLVGRHRKDDPISSLTNREREVLELMAEGRSNGGIAERMVVTERAVEKHVTSIFQKLGLPQAPEDHRRVLAVLTYLRSG